MDHDDTPHGGIGPLPHENADLRFDADQLLGFQPGESLLQSPPGGPETADQRLVGEKTVAGRMVRQGRAEFSIEPPDFRLYVFRYFSSPYPYCELIYCYATTIAKLCHNKCKAEVKFIPAGIDGLFFPARGTSAM